MGHCLSTDKSRCSAAAASSATRERRTPGGRSWTTTPATAGIVAAGPGLFQRHKDGRIFEFTGTPLTGWRQLDANPATVQLAAASGPHRLYQRHDTGSIFALQDDPIHLG